LSRYAFLPLLNVSTWRLVELETHDAFMNMAIDEAVAEKVAENEVPATIRFYRWQPSAVSIGYFQSLHDEIAVGKCIAAGVDYVRRRTGGGAVFHDYEGEITYSIIAPENYFPKGIIDSYHSICGLIMDGLHRLGIMTSFKPINDVVLADGVCDANGIDVGGRKISGNAQTRRGGVLLQHGTILFKVDVPKMFSLLKVGQEKIADKLIAAAEERVSCLHAVKPDLKYEDVYQALLEAFTYGKRYEKGEWTLSEMMRASELAERRYGSKEWREMR